MNSSHQVKQLRLQRAWSQEQLAELAGVSVRTIQRIENGDRPGLETLSALAAVFEVNVAEISGESPAGHEASLIYVLRKPSARRTREPFLPFIDGGRRRLRSLALLNWLSGAESYWSAWVAIVWGALLVVKGCACLFWRMD